MYLLAYTDKEKKIVKHLLLSYVHTFFFPHSVKFLRPWCFLWKARLIFLTTRYILKYV